MMDNLKPFFVFFVATPVIDVFQRVVQDSESPLSLFVPAWPVKSGGAKTFIQPPEEAEAAHTTER